MDKLQVFQSQLNPEFTFETFVTVAGTQFVHAAAKAVCESPGRVYNPLFISGPEGMGKTHLLHAIGHDVRRRFPEKSILYMTAGQLKNVYIDAISENKTRELERELEELDVLLLDNLEMLIGMEYTQMCFAPIMTHRTLLGKHTVFASAKSLSDLSFDNQLTSLIRQGLLTEPLLPPATEFFHEYLNRAGIKCTDDIVELGTFNYDNVGEMVCAIRQVKAKQDLLGLKPLDENEKDVSSDLWDQVLSKIKQELSQPKFETWFKSTKGTVLGDTVRIECPNSFVSEWLQQQYAELINRVIFEITGCRFHLNITSQEELVSLQSQLRTQEGRTSLEKDPLTKIAEQLNAICQELAKSNRLTAELLEEIRKLS